MAKNYLANYDTTAGNNTDIGGVNIAEGTAPSNINDAIREQMSHLAAFKSEFEVGADVASATATDVDVAGVIHDITGTTTITSLANPTNDTSHVKVLQFNGILTLTHSANLILPTSANITTAAGDVAGFIYEGSSVWRCIFYQRADGTAVSSDIVNDTTPQLGGDLDTNSNSIVTTSNADVVINPDGTGVISVSGTTDYENNVTDDDDIPNKAYVDSQVSITLGTEQDATNGGANDLTEIDFTSIPSGTKRITVYLMGISFNNTAAPVIQIGDSGGIETSGYTGRVANGNVTSSSAFSSSFRLLGSGNASLIYFCKATLELINESNNTWYESGILGANGAVQETSQGYKDLSGELDRVRVTSTTGTATFDAGEVVITYE